MHDKKNNCDTDPLQNSLIFKSVGQKPIKQSRYISINQSLLPKDEKVNCLDERPLLQCTTLCHIK